LAEKSARLKLGWGLKIYIVDVPTSVVDDDDVTPSPHFI
jgi:hypothetical protein